MSQPPYPQQPYQQPMPPKKSKLGLIIAVIVVVIVLILALFFFMMLQSHATLKVRVANGHIFSAVTYELYIDGSLKVSGNLSPLGYVEYTYDMYPGSSCHDYEVYASSTGAPLGPTSDSETVNLCAGQTKDVTLTV